MKYGGGGLIRTFFQLELSFIRFYVRYRLPGISPRHGWPLSIYSDLLQLRYQPAKSRSNTLIYQRWANVAYVDTTLTHNCTIIS